MVISSRSFNRLPHGRGSVARTWRDLHARRNRLSLFPDRGTRSLTKLGQPAAQAQKGIEQEQQNNRDDEKADAGEIVQNSLKHVGPRNKRSGPARKRERNLQ